MILSILLSLDPRGPEATVYLNRNGFGFSEDFSFPIRKKCRIRLGPKKLPYNSSLKLAKEFFKNLLKDTDKLNGKEWNVTNENYVAKVAGQGKSVHLEVGEKQSEKVLMFIKKFVELHNLSENVTNTDKQHKLPFRKSFRNPISFALAS